jgi:hypothetical protein
MLDLTLFDFIVTLVICCSLTYVAALAILG